MAGTRGKLNVALVIQNETDRRDMLDAIGHDSQFAVVRHGKDFNTTLLPEAVIKPDVIVLEMVESEEEGGLQLIRKIKKQYPACEVVILSEVKSYFAVFGSLKAGASGYILKNASVGKEMLSMLRVLASGGAPMSSEISRMVVRSFHSRKNARLTRREGEILQLLAQGKTYAQIANELIISKETSKTHIKNIYHKLKVNRKDQAIARGLDRRLLFQD